MFRKHHRNGITSTASEDQEFGNITNISVVRKIFLDLVADDRDPIIDPAPQHHIVKCRITRNRKGIRGEYVQLYNTMHRGELEGVKQSLFFSLQSWLLSKVNIELHCELCIVPRLKWQNFDVYISHCALYQTLTVRFVSDILPAHGARGREEGVPAGLQEESEELGLQCK